ARRRAREPPLVVGAPKRSAATPRARTLARDRAPKRPRGARRRRPLCAGRSSPAARRLQPDPSAADDRTRIDCSAMEATDLAFAGIARQAELIAAGDVSSRELVQLYLD